ncbi:TB2/DP1, HVA22 family-domain-containing protein [Dichotomocladium elegans]|nr:TB2/DP1, HVA22 family-domain-containing protein [Dichotomocladium elegans]
MSEHSKINNEKEDDEHERLYATSRAIQRLVHRVNCSLPINLDFITNPVAHASVSRVESLEQIYAKSRLVRFLVRKGVHPIVLFVGLSAGLVMGLRRFYRQSHYLALNLLGVVYPAWRCWQLVKEVDPSGDDEDDRRGRRRHDDYQSWLTYWMLYGSLQVLDAWKKDLIELFPNYELYKLLILYWAQNPDSNGASVLCRYVIQKPAYQQQQHEEQGQEKGYNYHYQQQQEASKSPATSTSSYSPPPPASPEMLTLTIEAPHHHHQRMLDGFTPTLQEVHNDHVSPKGYSLLDEEETAAGW